MRKFEATSDILDAVYYGDLVPIYQFEDLPSDESVYEEEIETDSYGSFNRVRITTTRMIGFKLPRAY